MAVRSNLPLLCVFALLLASSVALPALAETATAPATADAVKKEYSINVTGKVEIASDGTISHYTLDNSKALPLVQKALDNNIQRWRFQPILVDGKPVRAKTAMQVDISAEPVANGDYQLRLNNVSFGVPVRNKKRSAPQYPRNAAAMKVGAKVMLLLKLTPEGRVEQAYPQQVSLDHPTGSEAVADSWRELFSKATISAAKSWRFDTAPEFEGQPMPEAVLVPVVFKMLRDKDKWQAFVPGPVSHPEWLFTSKLAASGEQLQDGDALPIDNRIRLQDGVVGKLL